MSPMRTRKYIRTRKFNVVTITLSRTGQWPKLCMLVHVCVHVCGRGRGRVPARACACAWACLRVRVHGRACACVCMGVPARACAKNNTPLYKVQQLCPI